MLSVSPLPQIPSPLSKQVPRTSSFYLLSGEGPEFFGRNKNDENIKTIYLRADPWVFSKSKIYEIPAERTIAKICWFARQLFELVCLTKNENENPWTLNFTAEKLKGKSPEFVSYVDSAFKLKERDLKPNGHLKFHDVSVFLPEGYKINHAFQVIELDDNTKYLIDLTISQYFDKILRLKSEHTEVIYSLMQKGYVELTKENFEVYLNFFASRSQFDQGKTALKNEWSLEEKNFSYDSKNLLTSSYLYLGTPSLPVKKQPTAKTHTITKNKSKQVAVKKFPNKNKSIKKKRTYHPVLSSLSAKKQPAKPASETPAETNNKRKLDLTKSIQTSQEVLKKTKTQ